MRSVTSKINELLLILATASHVDLHSVVLRRIVSIRRRIADRLKALRLMRRVSQGELARLTGATQREISYYERGRSFPRPERLDRLASALRVDVSDLFLHPDRPLPSEIV